MHYEAIRERAGDGTLYEVIDLNGKVVSIAPMALTAARRDAEFRTADAANERDMLAITERE